MKSIINKLLLGAAITAMAGMTSCVGDLDQMPNDPSTIMEPSFKDNPREAIGRVIAKCYQGLAVSGQTGPDGDCDIKGIDGGTSQYTRGLFMLNEFTTDECMWVYDDAGGVKELVTGTWSAGNGVNYGIYSRFYVHIGVCNNFIRVARDLRKNGVEVGGTGDKAISQEEVDQFVREAKALRALSYYNVIDLWGRGVVAWDDIAVGVRPKQAESRTALYEKVVKDLEETLAAWPESLNGSEVVYGRIGKDAVEALLCRYYLNSEAWTGTPRYAECWTHAQNIINRHKGSGFVYNGEGTGLAKSYLSLFCGTNKYFMPGGDLADQNEILWGVPYDETMTQPYGGTTFLCNAAVKDAGTAALDEGFCNLTWYGLGNGWGCMHARQQFAEKFNFTDGASDDNRTYLWVTEKAGAKIGNETFEDFFDGYLPIKFTNLACNTDGTMPLWKDPDNGLNRAGVQPIVCTKYYPNTCLPLIRLADVYLMAAECTLHGAGDASLGLKYVNIIRARAGVSEYVSTDMTATNLLDERARELYWECTRRTDLVRFNRFIDGYNWNWKGGTYNGGMLDQHRNVFPLPSNVMAIYGSEMIQNTGY